MCFARSTTKLFDTVRKGATMTALKPTDFTGTVTFLGHVADRAKQLMSDPLQKIDAIFTGYNIEAHTGLTRLSDVRVKHQYPIDTLIRNTRQFSILSAEELADIAHEMGLEQFDPRWVGASIVIEGIPDFTRIPPSSRLQFTSGATLTVDMENRPCIYPGREIERDLPGKGKLFKPAAKGRRGVTGWVEREGAIQLGDQVRLHVPDQPRWAHAPD
ncbi:MAG: hypothetical protein ACI8YI_000782 [Paracoccaceae bacterium]